MQHTKQKIVNTTIRLFNESGFANVSLPHIAKAMGISLGNLTYHFPKSSLSSAHPAANSWLAPRLFA